MTLPPAGAVGDVAHRIDRLMRRSAGDQRMLPGSGRDGRQQRLDRRQDRRRFGQPPGAEFVAGHRALVRADDMNAARGEQRHVRLRRRVQPHPHIHRRRDQHRLVGRQQQRRGQIVRQPRRHLRQDVRRGRRHHDADRRCAKAGCAPSRFRRSARTGRCRPCSRSAPAATAA